MRFSFFEKRVAVGRKKMNDSDTRRARSHSTHTPDRRPKPDDAALTRARRDTPETPEPLWCLVCTLLLFDLV